MWNFRKNLPKNCVNTRFPDFLFLLVLVIISCAPRTVPVVPHQNLVDPLQNTDQPVFESYRTAYQSYLRGNQSKARSALLELIRKRPSYYPAHLAIAYTYIAEDKHDTAETYVRRALDLHPDYAQAHFALSTLLEARQDYPAALAELDEVARIDPQYPSIAQAQNILKLKATEQYLNLGRQMADSNPDEALKYLKAAHNMAPEIDQIPAEIAAILLKQHNCRDAVEYLRIAVDRQPNEVTLKSQLADCYMSLKEYSDAKLVLEQLAVQLPNDPSVRQRLEEAKKSIFISGLPEEYQRIPTASEITRGQFAAYLVIHLESLNSFRSESEKIAVDIIQYWAQSYIQKVVNLGIMDVFPNRTFQPNQPLTRLELARAVSRILEILEISKGRKFSTVQINIPDIPPDQVFYPIVAKPIANGILSLDADGRFHPSRRVSGAEAVSVVNQLKKIMESK
jgi:tetratricopeptide (TPR) repeat protein